MASDNGMITKIWGPAGWLFLHCITFGYPNTINPNNPDHLAKKNDYYNFFYYLGKVLPCKYCRDSYHKFMNILPLHDKLNNRHDICKWLYDIHNMVNNKLDITNIPTFNNIQKQYESYRAKCTNDKNTEGFNNNNIAPVGCINSANGLKSKCNIYITSTSHIPINKYYIILLILVLLALLILIIIAYFHAF